MPAIGITSIFINENPSRRTSVNSSRIGNSVIDAPITTMLRDVGSAPRLSTLVTRNSGTGSLTKERNSVTAHAIVPILIISPALIFFFSLPLGCRIDEPYV